MGIERGKAKDSFTLSAELGPQPHYEFKNDGEPYDPRMAIAADMQWQLKQVFKKFFTFKSDLLEYEVDYPEEHAEGELFRMDLYCPDDKKGSIARHREKNDALNRLVNRILKENPIQDFLYAESNYAVGGKIVIHYKPLVLIYALEMVVIQAFGNNDECRGRLHMAREILQRYENFKPAPQMN